ncbi:MULTISPECIES: hypothetical protein [unclassified Rhodanobacter]|uniref:hypothetical protein n=1 Tax=unclassified Rhodanobacter TaxID=2621553 RepID=UPI001BE0605A|nr:MULTISPECIES: hypothetical protein [unclassified Rhodanobacter]MBT2144667.1 hypothetical protein [Rhodanobacter sp. LX-99]MBT2148712.1 hypothetical protein [Rhodanobacter sp. LX-100]
MENPGKGHQGTDAGTEHTVIASTTLETDMPKTSHESQDALATPLPVDDENALADSEAEQESALARAPEPDTATRPSIKNN